MPLLRLTSGMLAALSLYVLLMAALVGGLFYVRSQVIADLSTPEAQAHWEDWRQREASRQEDLVVRRRIPKSAEPPHLVLVRDYFAGVLFSLTLTVSFLYAFLAILVRGMLKAPPYRPQLAEDQAPAAAGPESASGPPVP